MNALDIIRAKRDGHELTDEQVRWFIEQYTDCTVPTSSFRTVDGHRVSRYGATRARDVDGRDDRIG